MTTFTRPTDAQLQQMGIICVDTMLPPSPSMLAAGHVALLKHLKGKVTVNALIEQVFAAMVLEGLEDLSRLGATVQGDPALLAKHSRDSGFGATAEALNAPALVAGSAGLLSHAASERVLEQRDPQVSKKEKLEWARAQLLKQKGSLAEEGTGATVQKGCRGSVGCDYYDCRCPQEVLAEGSTGATVRPIPPGVQDSNAGDYVNNYTKRTAQ